MISNKTRETRKSRVAKMSKNIERLYKEGKCSECSVVVTRMDFAKILGKFNKVKIQYENSTAKGKKSNQQVTSPNSRLKRNENGMVLLHRKAYNQHPIKELSKGSQTRSKNALKENSKINTTSTLRQSNNILKENNRIKKGSGEERNLSFKNILDSNVKTYGIVFVNPVVKKINENKNKLSLRDLLPSINTSLLPTEDWCIDYLPKNGEPKEDKVYDRIAAELEDLMCNEKSAIKNDKEENKDDFPSIMDILNENTSGSNQSHSQSEFKPSLESSDDVEAILLGKSNDNKTDPTPMEVGNSDINLMNVVHMDTSQEPGKLSDVLDGMDNPHSPSILDEALQKGIEEHLPAITDKQAEVIDNLKTETNGNTTTAGPVDKENEDSVPLNWNAVTHVMFKKILDGVCSKSVICPKNMKYSVELDGKSVEFLGAPKFITSLEDLQVLLQIVNDSNLNSLYVLH